jgi:hypothetical protein
MPASAQVAASGRPQKSIVLEIATTGTGAIDKRFETQVSDVNFAPTSAQATWQGGIPTAQLTATGEPTWVANLTLIQAYDDPNSLARFLLANYGKTATITYYPHDDASFGITTTLVLPAPTIGGPVNQFNEASVSAQCTRPSVVTTAVPALP